MNKHPSSTFDRIMQDSKRREQFEETYRGFLLVEVLLPLLEKDKMPVRLLAKTAGLSPTVIQDIKSGKKESISFKTFMAILNALGYSAVLEIGKEKAKPQRHELLHVPKQRHSKVRRRKVGKAFS